MRRRTLRHRLRKLFPDDLVAAMLVMLALAIVAVVTYLGLSTVVGGLETCQGLPCLG